MVMYLRNILFYNMPNIEEKNSFATGYLKVNIINDDTDHYSKENIVETVLKDYILNVNIVSPPSIDSMSHINVGYFWLLIFT